MSECLNSWGSLKWHEAPKSLHCSIRRWRFSLKKRFLKSVQIIPKASGIRTQSDCSRDILMKLPGWAVYQRLREMSGGRMSSNSCWTAIQQRGLCCRISNILPWCHSCRRNLDISDQACCQPWEWLRASSIHSWKLIYFLPLFSRSPEPPALLERNSSLLSGVNESREEASQMCKVGFALKKVACHKLLLSPAPLWHTSPWPRLNRVSQLHFVGSPNDERPHHLFQHLPIKEWSFWSHTAQSQSSLLFTMYFKDASWAKEPISNKM